MLSLKSFTQKSQEAGICLDAAAVYADGTLLALERFSDTVRHNVFSVSKSFLSTAIGMAVTDGVLTLEDKPFDVFPNLFPTDYDPNWQKVTLRHLLTMSTGNDGARLMTGERHFLRGEKEEQPSEDIRTEWLRYAFSIPLPYEPGTCFSYSNASPYIAGRMLEEKTGMTVCDYLYERLWEPMHSAYPRWDRDGSGHTFPASDLFLDITDMLKLGVMYLNGGVYEGKRYLPEAWVELASRKHVQSRAVNPTGTGPDEECGYGFFFWRMRLPGAYMAYGREGQFVIVYPKKRAVICVQAMHHNITDILELVQSEIIPQLL